MRCCSSALWVRRVDIALIMLIVPSTAAATLEADAGP